MRKFSAMFDAIAVLKTLLHSEYFAIKIRNCDLAGEGGNLLLTNTCDNG